MREINQQELELVSGGAFTSLSGLTVGVGTLLGAVATLYGAKSGNSGVLLGGLAVVVPPLATAATLVGLVTVN